MTEEIEQNLKHWMRWSFLKIGAWQDVNIPASGYYGGDFSLLSPAIDSSFDDYSVYETPKLDLVFEEDVDFNGAEPIGISGVWINSAFYPQNDVTYGHYVDYENGRVIFTNALSATDEVKMNYSYRTVSIQIADESEIWKEVQYGTLRVDDPHVLDNTKGEWTAIPSLKRQQLPVIVLEAVSKGTQKPYEIGGQTMYVYRDILAHILSENRYLRNRLADILAFEQEHVIWLFNSDALAGSTDWPLDYRGAKTSTGLNYEALIEAHKWLKMTIKESVISEVESFHPRLIEATVRLKTETIFGRD